MHQFGHIGIYVKNLEESKKFYIDILECEIVKEYTYPEMTLCFLNAGGTHIELIEKKTPIVRTESGPIDHLAFKVEALAPLIEKLKENQIELISEPRIVGSSRIVFFKGPNNERFEFVERYQK